MIKCLKTQNGIAVLLKSQLRQMQRVMVKPRSQPRWATAQLRQWPLYWSIAKGQGTHRAKDGRTKQQNNYCTKTDQASSIRNHKTFVPPASLIVPASCCTLPGDMYQDLLQMQL